MRAPCGPAREFSPESRQPWTVPYGIGTGHALHIAVTGGRADHVGSNDRTRSASHATVDGVAQVGGGPLIQRAHIAKRREAVTHLLRGVVKSCKCFGRPATEAFAAAGAAVQPIDAEMN